jgi:hypothetical protein
MKAEEKRDYEDFGYDNLTHKLRGSKKVGAIKTFKSIRDDAVDK